MNNNDKKIIMLTGKISKELFYDDEKKWGVYSFTTTEKIYSEALSPNKYGNVMFGTVTGNIQPLEEGQKYIMELTEEYNRRYDKMQFKAENIYSEIPKTISQKRDFLSSILTKLQTDTLLENYPNIISMAINNDEIDVSVLHNISEKTIEDMKNKIIASYGLSDLIEFFKPYGVSFKQIQKMSSLNSNTTLLKESILENPYILTKVKGIGFKVTDEIAMKIKPELKHSEERVYALLDFVLDREANGDGHTWLSKNEMLLYGNSLVPECIDILKDVLSRSHDESGFLHIDGDRIGRMSDYNTEKKIYEQLERINSGETCIDLPTDEQVNSMMVEIEEEQGFELSVEQKATLHALSNTGNVVIVSGQSGSGKTTVVNSISTILEKTQRENGKKPLVVSQMALSAKASMRLVEITDRHSTTIHKFLYELEKVEKAQSDINFENTEEIQDAIMEVQKVATSDVIIIDEFSMVNIYITLRVLKMVKEGAVVVFVFDYAQLPSIGAGAVSYDILEYSHYNKSKYTEVHRQGRKSGILMDANTIRTQENPLKTYKKSITTGELEDMTYLFRNDKDDINKTAIRAFVNGVKKFGVDNINIICPRKDKVLNSAKELNKEIQSLIIPKGTAPEYYDNVTKTIFRLGDKVIHRKNMPELKVINGEVGTVTDISKDQNDSKPVTVTFKTNHGEKIVNYDVLALKSLQLAYALTVHSYQGSENKAIIVVLDGASNMLLDNTMLYTAITRAKERCVVVSDPNSFSKCIREHKTLIRNTWLKNILIEGVK